MVLNYRPKEETIVETGEFYPPGPVGMTEREFMSRPEMGIPAANKFQNYLERQYRQGVPYIPHGNPHYNENVGYTQMMQNQYPFYEDRIVDVARRNDPFVGAMLEQMYDQDPYRGYGQLGDNYKPNITMDFEGINPTPEDDQGVIRDIIDGLKDTYKIFYDHGAITPAISDYFGVAPNEDYYSEYLNEMLGDDEVSEFVEDVITYSPFD
tara:strand:+ start:376 stop:1002 length:627 start_codon:yes stop_codon:yes gene_type:complete